MSGEKKSHNYNNLKGKRGKKLIIKTIKSLNGTCQSHYPTHNYYCLQDFKFIYQQCQLIHVPQVNTSICQCHDAVAALLYNFMGVLCIHNTHRLLYDFNDYLNMTIFFFFDIVIIYLDRKKFAETC